MSCHFCFGDKLSPEEPTEEAKPAPAAAAPASPAAPAAKAATAAPAKAAPAAESGENNKAGPTAEPARAKPKEADATGYTQMPPAYAPPPPPPRKPMFTKENVPKFLAFGLLISYLLLFIGAMLTAGGSFIDPADGDLKRNLLASGILIDGIGLFMASIFIILPLSRDFFIK